MVEQKLDVSRVVQEVVVVPATRYEGAKAFEAKSIITLSHEELTTIGGGVITMGGIGGTTLGGGKIGGPFGPPPSANNG